MAERLEGQEVTGFSEDQLIALSGLRVAVNPSAWPGWGDLMPHGSEVVDVAVSQVEFGGNEQPVAFGVSYLEMLRTIGEHGDIESPLARIIASDAKRVMMFTADGLNTWPPVPKVRQDQPSADPYEVSYI